MTKMTRGCQDHTKSIVIPPTIISVLTVILMRMMTIVKWFDRIRSDQFYDGKIPGFNFKQCKHSIKWEETVIFAMSHYRYKNVLNMILKMLFDQSLFRHSYYCKYILQIGQQDIPAHRVVLAAASPYLMELFSREDIGFRPSRKEVISHCNRLLQI